ncbi:uncharacterized protein [Hetaerina americana]|uniref:uncharacterized protein n=1 Tax=Hetaerina americana TaxID=62018 RepID=UPI003A7F22E7
MDETETESSSMKRSPEVKSEPLAMEVDIDKNVSGQENHDKDNVLASIPVFACSVVGGCVTLQDYRDGGVRIDVNQCLLFTLCLIHLTFGDSPANSEVVNVGNGAFSNICIVAIWKYFKGYLNLKVGKLKEAFDEIEEADFAKFPVHFKSKKAILTAIILLKMNKPMIALTILNKDALECEDCLPHSLLHISEAYECLDYDESLLGVLRQLVKVCM